MKCQSMPTNIQAAAQKTEQNQNQHDKIYAMKNS